MNPEPVPEFDSTSRIGIWGPPAGAIEATDRHAPRRKRPWGLLDVLWVGLGLIGVQLLLVPIFIFVVLSRQTIEVDSVEAVDQLMTEVTDMATTGPGLVAALLTQWAVFVGVPLYASYRKGHRSIAKDFGFVFRRRDPLTGLGVALLMQVAFVASGYLLSLTSLDLRGADNTGMVTDNVGVFLVLMLFAAAVFAPVTEELLFRGLILRAFLRTFAKRDLAPPLAGLTDHINTTPVSDSRRRWGTWVSVFLSALIFGALHTPISDGTNVVTTAAQVVLITQTGLLGLLFAVIALRTRRLGVTICAHVAFNSISVALALLT